MAFLEYPIPWVKTYLAHSPILWSDLFYYSIKIHPKVRLALEISQMN